jgi:CheY-like chemotaxis protein
MNANIRILLIEDDQDDIDLLKEALSENGVKASFDILMQGNRIVEWLSNSPPAPDLIIMDLNLPKMHGREVLTHIKSQQRYKHVPVMVLTTSSQADEKAFCLANGAEQFVSKPATHDGFIALVEMITRMARRSAN